MRTRWSFVVPVVLVSVLFAACTDDEPKGGGSTPSGSRTSSENTPGTDPAIPGEYSYENAGVIATLKYEPDESTLSVTNRTGAELPEPGIYMLDARDGHRIAGTVEDAEPIPTGGPADFKVTFDSPVEPSNVGLMILLIGHANYGAFVPPAQGTA
jgi:hypothetical protein